MTDGGLEVVDDADYDKRLFMLETGEVNSNALSQHPDHKACHRDPERLGSVTQA